MRIAPTQGFLTLRSEPSPSNPTVAIAPSLASVIRGWTSGTRVSPLWGFAGMGTLRNQFSGRHIVLFLGPVSPSRVLSEVDLHDRPGKLNIWVSLGTFNLILRVDSNSDGRVAIDKVCKWASSHQVAYERWVVEDGAVKNWRAAPLRTIRANATFNRLAKLSQKPFGNGLNIHAQEFFVLAASALSRAASVDVGIHADLIQVASEMASNIEEAIEKPSDILDVSAELIRLNAALSRFSSQAFSGISPITATECHFWIHSLLGTGSANIALAKLVEFITLRLGDARLPERCLALKKVITGVPTWETLVGNDALLWQDHIGDVVLGAADIEEPLQPIVTYFSGRDGYSSQLQTLSAPLTSLAQANSFQTNILTVTHEIAHVFVEGILGYLYPDPDDKEEIASLTELVTSEREPANLFEAARKLLTEAVITMQQLHQETQIRNRSISPERMLEMLTRWRREAKEIMVHTFDYLYFFRDEPDRYVKAIWSTWCAIPGISERIPEYIVRTLCAISPKLLRLDPINRRETARAVFIKAITELTQDASLSTDYAKKALKHLEENWSVAKSGSPSISARYDIWLYLVRLTTMFMHSDRVAATLFNEPHVTVGGVKRHGKVARLYDDRPIGNPIRFVREHLAKSPSEAESVWLLHNVAFCLRSKT